MGVDIQADVKTIRGISTIPTILEVVCRITGMGFAAVARVTEEKWVALAVHDEIKFGLVPGGELKLDTTICHEIRQSGTSVVIDHVEKDAFYASHHTPAMYGFQSYISVPIKRSNGEFYGTLCAIDPRPAILNTPEIINMFRLYADLISLHLSAENLPADEIKRLDDHTQTELRGIMAAISEEDKFKMTDKRSARFIDVLNESTDRMRKLIGNLLNPVRN